MYTDGYSQLLVEPSFYGVWGKFLLKFEKLSRTPFEWKVFQPYHYQICLRDYPVCLPSGGPILGALLVLCRYSATFSLSSLLISNLLDKVYSFKIIQKEQPQVIFKTKLLAEQVS